MKNEIKEKKNIVSLKTLHIFTAVFSFIFMLALIWLKGDWSDWSSYVPVFAAVFADTKFEREDELARLHISKANTATMWTLIASLLLLYMKGRFSTIPANHYLIIICGAVALRSILFLIFDMTFAGEEDE